MKVIVKRDGYLIWDITKPEYEDKHILGGRCHMERSSRLYHFCEYKSNIFIIMEDFR